LPNRPPDAELAISAGALGDESDPLTLGFRVSEDSAYFSTHRIEERNGRLAVNNFFLVADSYCVGKIELRLGVRVNGAECDLVFFNIPIPRNDSAGIVPCKGASESDRDKDGVFFDIGHVVYGPQGIIPSLVRLEPFKNRYDPRKENHLSHRLFGPSKRRSLCRRESRRSA